MSLWRIRKPDQRVFGPVPWEVVRRWADEGRVLPGDGLSEDGGPWQPAADVAALEFDWLLERPDGTLIGPFSARVFAESLRKRILAGDETVRHRATAARQTTAQLALDELARQLEAHRASAESSPPERPPEEAGAGEGGNFQRNLARRYEALLLRAREQDDALRALRRELAGAQAGQQETIAGLHAALEKAAADAERSRKRIAELEGQLAELTREHRTLNERYIQVRDGGPGGRAPANRPKVRLA